MSNEFKRYTRTEPVLQMRKLSLEEVLGEVDVTRGTRVANAGDMLAKDSKDQWLIPKDVVEKYYKLVEDKDVEANPDKIKYFQGLDMSISFIEAQKMMDEFKVTASKDIKEEAEDKTLNFDYSMFSDFGYGTSTGALLGQDKPDDGTIKVKRIPNGVCCEGDIVGCDCGLIEEDKPEAKPVFIGRMGLETPVERFKDTLNHFTRVMSDYNVVFCYNDTDETVFEIVK